MTSIIDSTRKNHALEHATMTILAERYRGVRMMGHSSPVGFILMADLPTEIVTEAVLEAKRRLETVSQTWRCILIAALTWRSQALPAVPRHSACLGY